MQCVVKETVLPLQRENCCETVYLQALHVVYAPKGSLQVTSLRRRQLGCCVAGVPHCKSGKRVSADHQPLAASAHQ